MYVYLALMYVYLALMYVYLALMYVYVHTHPCMRANERLYRKVNTHATHTRIRTTHTRTARARPRDHELAPPLDYTPTRGHAYQHACMHAYIQGKTS